MKIRTLALLAITLFVGALTTGSASYASTGQSGYVKTIHIMDGGIVLFHHTGTRDAPPGCAAVEPTRWAFNATTPAGQAKLSTLLTAYAAHKPITIIGYGSCAVWGDTETMNYFRTDD